MWQGRVIRPVLSAQPQAIIALRHWSCDIGSSASAIIVQFLGLLNDSQNALLHDITHDLQALCLSNLELLGTSLEPQSTSLECDSF